MLLPPGPGPRYLRFLAGLLPLLCAARAGVVLDEWRFDAPAGRSLHLSDNTAANRTAPDARWDVAIPGVATTDVRTLRIRNAGDGGPGRRTTFVNFAVEQTAGQVAILLDLEAWSLAMPPAGPPPRLELGFVQGATRLAAGIVVELAPAGLRIGWHTADGIDHWGAPLLPATSASPLRLRLDLDLTDRLLALGRLRDGLPDERIAIAALPPLIDRLTSLRLTLSGDFTAGGQTNRFLDVGLIRVEAGATPGFPGLAPGPDGLPGLLHAALGAERPDVSTTEALPQLVPVTGAGSAFRFFRARADLDYLVETSTDLVLWQEIARNPGQPDSFASFPVTAPEPPANRRFFRLRIALPGP